jgi:hypothetical protein
MSVGIHVHMLMRAADVRFRVVKADLR